MTAGADTMLSDAEACALMARGDLDMAATLRARGDEAGAAEFQRSGEFFWRESEDPGFWKRPLAWHQRDSMWLQSWVLQGVQCFAPVARIYRQWLDAKTLGDWTAEVRFRLPDGRAWRAAPSSAAHGRTLVEAHLDGVETWGACRIVPPDRLAAAHAAYRAEQER